MPWTLLVSAALAHGPAPAVVAVGTVDADGPVHVTLTEGLAVRSEAGFRYVCPAVHGSSPEAPKVGGTPDAAWLPGADGLYGVDRAGSVWPTGNEDLAITAILGLVHDGRGGVWALTPDGADRAVWDVTAGVPIHSTSAPVTGIAVGDGVIECLGFDGEQLDRTTLALDGAVLDSAVLGTASGTNPIPRVAADTLWVIDRSAGSAALLRVDGDGLTPVGPGVEAVLGPIEADDAVLVALDGALHEVVGDDVVPVGVDGVTCLAALDGQALACVDGRLHRLGPDGVGDEVLSPEQVIAPDWALVPEEDLALCYSEWRVWANDVGVDPGPYPDDEAPPATEPGTPGAPDPAEPAPAGVELTEPSGCGCASGGTSPAWAWLLPVLLLFRRNRSSTARFPCRGGSGSSSRTARRRVR